MIEPILWGAYIGGALYCFRCFARWVTYLEGGHREPGADAISTGIMIGALGALLWPPIVLLWALRQTTLKLNSNPKRAWLAFLGQTSEQKMRRKEQELVKRKQRVKQLEEELGIK